MVTLADPVRTGLVASLAAHGGNVTGMSNIATELAAKRLSILKEAVPSITRVLVLTYNADPISPLQVESVNRPLLIWV
jgi:putative ABC transport system substrate-binding protein